MLVCHCLAVSDRTIRACARAGAASLAEVGALCGAGTACGGCASAIEGLVCRERADATARGWGSAHGDGAAAHTVALTVPASARRRAA